MNIVDSCGWLEYFANGENADFFSPAITDEINLLVPTICIYEVFNKLCQQLGSEEALQAIGIMYRAQVIDLDSETALTAATLSLKHHLPMVDSILLATARVNRATLWTQDEHLRHMNGVKYIHKTP